MVATGKLKYRETIANGLDAAPEAFFGMLKGKNFGKQLVKLVKKTGATPKERARRFAARDLVLKASSPLEVQREADANDARRQDRVAARRQQVARADRRRCVDDRVGVVDVEEVDLRAEAARCRSGTVFDRRTSNITTFVIALVAALGSAESSGWRGSA